MDTKFKNFWKNDFNKIEKNLSGRDLLKIREFIIGLEDRETPSSVGIQLLLERFPQLGTKDHAELVYWTELKRVQSNEIIEDAEFLEFKKFRIIPGPNACPICKDFSQNGDKIFRKSQLEKDGWDVPPIHPNCYCALVIAN